ncbi:hypothetical protein pb186bvf_009026 [Paramecium bursaria]
MADDGGADKSEYISEEVLQALTEAVFGVFQVKENEPAPGNLIYQKDKVTSWSNQLIDYTIRNLNKLGKAFKYCVTCYVSQNNEAKFTTSFSMHTDDKDGACHVVREFNDIVVVITVFALLI